MRQLEGNYQLRTLRELMEEEWQRPGCRNPWHRCGWRVWGFDTILRHLTPVKGWRYWRVRRHTVRWPRST
jgi:hypothetical protein